MSNKKYTPRYNVEFRERAVRLLTEQRSSYPSDNAAYIGVGSSLGCSPDSLRSWCHQAQKDAGDRPGLSTEDRARIKELEREVRHLRQANEILKRASAYFAQAELGRPFPKS